MSFAWEQKGALVRFHLNYDIKNWDHSNPTNENGILWYAHLAVLLFHFHRIVDAPEFEGNQTWSWPYQFVTVMASNRCWCGDQAYIPFGAMRWIHGTLLILPYCSICSGKESDEKCFIVGCKIYEFCARGWIKLFVVFLRRLAADKLNQLPICGQLNPLGKQKSSNYNRVTCHGYRLDRRKGDGYCLTVVKNIWGSKEEKHTGR